MSLPCTARANVFATAAHVGVSASDAPPGRAIRGTGHHVQSVLSPPILITGLPPGARLRTSCSNGASSADGLPPASVVKPLNSIESPRKPLGTGWLTGL